MGGAEAYRVDGGPAGVGLDRVSSTLHLAWRVPSTIANLCVIRVPSNDCPTKCAAVTPACRCTPAATTLTPWAWPMTPTPSLS